MDKKQISWQRYFLEIATLVASRSDCISRGVGAVIVRDKSIIATGYNGAPHGIKNCSKGGCDRCTAKMHGKIPSGQQLDKCICAHAEENAIAQAANNGISTKDASLYCTHLPCTLCTKLIIQSGVKKIVYKEEYGDLLSKKYLKEAKLSLFHLKNFLHNT